MLKTFILQIKEVYMYIRLMITHIVGIILLFCKFPHCCIVSMIHRSSREVWVLSSQSMTAWTEWAAPWRTRVQNPTDQKLTKNSVPWRPSGIPSVPSQWTGKGMFNYPLKPCCSKWCVIYQLLDVWVLLAGSNLDLCPCRQRKLEEALLFAGQFSEALQALLDWLAKVEPTLGEDQPVYGDVFTVNNLMEIHKVSDRENCRQPA